MKIKIIKSGITPFLLGVLMMALGFTSCKKDSYRTDGGVASANTTLSTYDYLAGNAYHYFDTLLLIVDHFGLKDSVNKAGTFFAPTDYAISALMDYAGHTVAVDQRPAGSKRIQHHCEFVERIRAGVCDQHGLLPDAGRPIQNNHAANNFDLACDERANRNGSDGL